MVTYCILHHKIHYICECCGWYTHLVKVKQRYRTVIFIKNIIQQYKYILNNKYNTIDHLFKKFTLP